jgi:Bacterial RNA polymerase, alpha chain C terminal domain
MSQVLTTRGQREAKDIIDAAEAQGWTFRGTGRTGGGHLRMIPPNGGVPVGVSATPSDVHFLKQIIRKMRRADPGFIWPWPPKKEASKNGKSMTIPTVEQWKPILGMEGLFELSKTGGVRKRGNNRRLVVVDGKVKLWDPNKRMLFTKDVAELVRLHFGCEPLKTPPQVAAEPTVEHHRVSQCIEPEEGTERARLADAQETDKETDDNINQESNDMTIQAESLGLPMEPLSNANSEAEERDVWRDVHLPNIIEGYRVSRVGEVRSPVRLSGRGGKVLEPQIVGVNLWVSLERSDTPKWASRSTRVDRLVLLAFAGEPPTPEHEPVHRNGDTLDCTLGNLEWGIEPRKTKPEFNQTDASRRAFQKPRPAPMSIEQAQAAGIDEYSPEPEPDVPVVAMTPAERLAGKNPKVISIDELGNEFQWTIRTYNCLKREGIHYAWDLTQRTETDLLDIRNFGQRGVDEVKATLVALGLSLKRSPIPAGTITDFAGTTADGRGGLVDYEDGLKKSQEAEQQDEVEELRVLLYDGIKVQFVSDHLHPTDVIIVSDRSAIALAKILRKLGAI